MYSFSKVFIISSVLWIIISRNHPTYFEQTCKYFYKYQNCIIFVCYFLSWFCKWLLIIEYLSRVILDIDYHFFSKHLYLLFSPAIDKFPIHAIFWLLLLSVNKKDKKIFFITAKCSEVIKLMIVTWKRSTQKYNQILISTLLLSKNTTDYFFLSLYFPLSASYGNHHCHCLVYTTYVSLTSGSCSDVIEWAWLTSHSIQKHDVM